MRLNKKHNNIVYIREDSKMTLLQRYRSKLYHYGIKGMHWGVRRTPEELGYTSGYRSGTLKIKSMPRSKDINNIHFRTAKMPIEEYSRACDLWRKCRELNIPQREKEHVYEEFDYNLTDDEKERCLVYGEVNNYWYTAINKGHNQYKIINKKVIYNDGSEDAILTEVIGPDWRDYDDQ